MSLCFGSAWRAMQNNELTEEEYLRQLLAHFKGVRHPEDSNHQNLDLRRHIPVASSIREIALRNDYQVFTDTTSIEQLFNNCLAGNTEQVRIDLEQMSSEPMLPHILRPLATLAASKGHAEILQLCVDKGVVFNRHLDAGIREGITHSAMLEVIWRVNWQNIQNSQDTMNTLLEIFLRRDTGTGLVTWLFEHGANVNIKTVQAAIWYSRNMPKMRMFMENYGISKLKDALKGTAALQSAAEEGNLEALNFLLDAGIDIDNIGPQRDMREPRPFSALYEGVLTQRADVVELLLDRGAQWDISCGFRIGTPWELAMKQGNEKIVNLLKSKAAELEQMQASKKKAEL